MKRHELTSEQWGLIQPLLPPPASTRRPAKDRRLMLSGILWLLCTGAPWRHLPERFGPWRTVYGYFQQWEADGTFDRILGTPQIRLDREGKIDWDLWSIDGASGRATVVRQFLPFVVVRGTQDGHVRPEMDVVADGDPAVGVPLGIVNGDPSAHGAILRARDVDGACQKGRVGSLPARNTEQMAESMRLALSDEAADQLEVDRRRFLAYHAGPTVQGKAAETMAARILSLGVGDPARTD